MLTTAKLCDLPDAVPPWDRVSIVRDTKRPSALALMDALFADFLELHGDRVCGDDSALVAGLAFLGDIPVTVLAQERGRNLKERQMRNFAMLHPEGYRKAKRLALQAERFCRPVICIVDTPGAYPGVSAEQRGQAEAIAQCLLVFSQIKTPVVTVVLGQGGSGGALAMSTSDRIYMFENAIYSVISPEGFASICWKDAGRAKEAASVMKLTAHDLMGLGVIDGIIPEVGGGLHLNAEPSFLALRGILDAAVRELRLLAPDRLVAERRSKLRTLI